MDIRILHLVDGAKEARGTTVIIDVFRAFTVETYLMRNHAAKIIPVSGVDFAFDYRKKHPDAILCGERKGIIVDGFDYGNSPSQIENVDFTGKTVIHTTSAGTQGIANAVHADEIIGGNLVAAKAIAAYIKKKNPEVVSLVCMGLAGGRQTDEDELCGAYIKSLLEGKPLPDLYERIMKLKETDGAKFFEEKRQAVFPKRDFRLCTDVNSCNFILRLKKDPETGLNCMERVDVDCSVLDIETPVAPGSMASDYTRGQAENFPRDIVTKAVYGNYQDPEGDFDAALLLGGKPHVLYARAKAAAELYLQGKCPLIIPTGGVKWQTEFGFCSECEALTRYLVQLGVPMENILQENQATTTIENMTFGQKCLQSRFGNAPIRLGVVTSYSHLRRSVGLAKRNIPQADCVPVRSVEPFDTPEECFSDYAAEFRTRRECRLLCHYAAKDLIDDFTL